MNNIHALPIKFSRHARDMLIKRFDMNLERAKKCIKTCKLVKSPKKDGDLGIMQGKEIRFVFKVRDGILWIITAEAKK